MSKNNTSLHKNVKQSTQKVINEETKDSYVKVKCPLNLRTAPNMNASIVRVLAANEELKVISCKGEWIEVKDGFCMKQFTEKIDK